MYRTGMFLPFFRGRLYPKLELSSQSKIEKRVEREKENKSGMAKERVTPLQLDIFCTLSFFKNAGVVIPSEELMYVPMEEAFANV